MKIISSDNYNILCYNEKGVYILIDLNMYKKVITKIVL